MPRSLNCPHAQLPCTPIEWHQGGPRFHIIKSVSLQISCSDHLLVRSGSFTLEFRFCIEDTEPGHIIQPISEFFCRGCTEKVGEWLCRIYNYTPISVPWLNPHGFLTVINEIISFYWSFGESKLIYLYHFNMEWWKVGIAPSPFYFFVRKTLLYLFTFKHKILEARYTCKRLYAHKHNSSFLRVIFSILQDN